MTRALLVLALAAALPACALLDGSDDALAGHVQADADGRTIVIRNGTSERVYYAAFSHDALARSQWTQLLDDESSLAPGERVRLPYAAVYGALQDDEAVVYWWHAEVRDGQRVPAMPASILVRL